jgi:hypothetical protein
MYSSVVVGYPGLGSISAKDLLIPFSVVKMTVYFPGMAL